jgi:DNA-binding GntR family transcriptional regulator
MKSTNDSYKQQAYEFVRQKILTMEYKPGDFITDSKIASELNFSRTPVREACQRLEYDGLLISGARRGWQIYSLTIEDIDNIFDLKCEIEGLIARKAAMCQDTNHKKALQEILREMKEASENDDIDSWLKSDTSLHHLLYVMANNDRAERYINNLNDQWHRLRSGYIKMMGRLDSSTKEHEKFITAVINNNPDEADKAMQEHLNDVREGLLKILVTMILPYARNGL